jgi:hypothetical protein
MYRYNNIELAQSNNVVTSYLDIKPYPDGTGPDWHLPPA